MASSDILWGIDLGGTKIEGVTIRHGKTPEILHRIRIPTEKEKGYRHIISRIHLLLQQLEKKTGSKAPQIGIGIPGTHDPEKQTVKNANTTALIGKPLKEDLQEALQIPVKLANDANCFALAETKFGVVKKASPDASVIFGVIIGTGVGGGLTVDGKIVHGLHGIAGEWGHNFLDESGGRCYCGKTGCVETIISGPALEAYYYKQTGEQKTLETINALHEQNINPDATQTIERLWYFFGKGIAQVINIIDPEVIVIGGGVGNINSLYSKGPEAVMPHIFNHNLNTRFLAPKLGDSAGVIGAAFLTNSEGEDKK